MTTPNAAKHRDLEERFRFIEGQIRTLTGALLHRKQQNVSAGDFVVSGGGSVVVEDGGGVKVRDGGGVVTTYPTGQDAVRFGPRQLMTSATTTAEAYGYWVTDEQSRDVFVAFRMPPNTQYPNGLTTVRVGAPEGSPNPVTAFFVNAAQWADVTAGSSVTITGGGRKLTVGSSGTTIYAPGTSASANVNMDANGLLRLVGSKRALKQDITPAGWSKDQVLGLEAVTWQDRAEASGNSKAPRYAGFVAEDVHAAGLTELVMYDENGEPASVAYDRLPAALLRVCQDQQSEIDELRSRLERLEARLDGQQHADQKR